VLSGSSDGLVRVVELYPTKLLGTLADHGEFPVERVRVDEGGQGRWVASVGHEEVIRMTDLRDVFEDEKDEEDAEDDEDAQTDDAASAAHVASSDDDGARPKGKAAMVVAEQQDNDDEDDELATAPKHESKLAGDDRDSDDGTVKERKRKRKDRDPLGAMKRSKKAGRNEVQAEQTFFADL
jgi:hypothetical protein